MFPVHSAMPKRVKESPEKFREWIHSARGIIKLKNGDQPLAEWVAELKGEAQKPEDRKLHRHSPRQNQTTHRANAPRL